MVTALPAGSSATAIAQAMAAASDTGCGCFLAIFEGNTYVLMELGTGVNGLASSDVFIKLTGVVDLPIFAADVIA